MRQFTTIMLVCGLASCGSGGDGPDASSSDPGAVNTASASGVSSSAVSLRAAVTSANGMAAAAAVLGMTSAGQSMVTPEQQQQAARTLGPSFAAGDCICNESGCTFDQCASGSYLVSGSITKSGDSYTFNLTSTGDVGGVLWSYTYGGTMTISATAVDGSFAADGTGVLSGQGIDLTYTFGTDLAFGGVALDGMGCATGGTLRATNVYAISSASASNYDVTGSVTFGPACGDVMAN